MKTICCRGQLLNLETPKVMGIINITPDSFYVQSRYTYLDQALQQAETQLQQGATFIDIGGASSRPGATAISSSEETQRILPIIDALYRRFPQALISADTYHATTAAAAVGAGAALINDISGGSMDDQLWATIAQLRVPYVLMHMKGTPTTMQQQPQYDDVVLEVADFFQQHLAQLQAMGINDVILDVGFGFGKTIAHNYQLLKNLSVFQTLFQRPMLVGLSRKSMLYKLLQTTPEKALNATTVAHTIALLQGASILRTHDVAEAIETISIVKQLQQ